LRKSKPKNAHHDGTTLVYELFMNVLFKFYGLSYPIVEAIPKGWSGSGRVSENVHPFLYHDALRRGRDLLPAIHGCPQQGMEAASTPHQ